MARYWLINTAVTAVPLSAHPSPLVITTKLVAAILDGRLFGGGVLSAQYCPMWFVQDIQVSTCIVVMICAALVNIQTHRQLLTGYTISSAN